MTSADSAIRETVQRSLPPTLGRTVSKLGDHIGEHALHAMWEQCMQASNIISDS